MRLILRDSATHHMTSTAGFRLKVFHSLGFRTQALLSGCVKNENGLTEDLVIMSHDCPMTA